VLFTLDELLPKDHEVLARIEKMRETMQWFTRDARRWDGLLRRSLFARAIRGSNSIEGYNASIDDAIAAVEGEEPLEAEDITWKATIGYRNAMTYVLQLAKDQHFTYSQSLIRSLHYMMLYYDLSKHPGLWRPGVIYVRHEPSGEIVYEGPGAERVPELIDELIEGLNNAGDEVPVMVRAAMAHLNLAMIHPFSDGNGRMARCLQTLVLARQGILAPEFCSIEEYLGRNTEVYYEILAEVGQGGWHPGNDVRPWVRFCLTAHYRQAGTVLRRLREYGKMWEELDRERNRHGLHERMTLALLDAAFGHRVRNSTYRAAAEISQNLASRDLKHLADRGLLVPKGERRGRFYIASDDIKAMRERVREPKKIEDPFDTEEIFLPGLAPALP